jgi:HEAT repeat protein
MYEQCLDTLEGRKQGTGYEPELAFKRRVHAMWGLIAKGVEAIPYALTLLRRPEAEAREDAAAILETVGKDNVVVDELLKSLESETTLTVKDSLLIAVGRFKSRKAIPLLAKIIRNQREDLDTRWTAVESLGLIVRRRFLNQTDPVQSAIDWLAKHPEETKARE